MSNEVAGAAAACGPSVEGDGQGHGAAWVALALLMASIGVAAALISAL
jgi:hypothetical protein